MKLFTPRFTLLRGLHTLGDGNLSLVRVGTFIPGSIYGGGDVEVSNSGLNRVVGKGSVGIQGVDLGVRPTRRVAAIDVVADYSG